MKYLAAAATTLALAPLTTASQLVWPSKWDELEDYYTMMNGYNKRGFADALLTCEFGNNVPGQQNSAEWLRTAFHDSITHDVKAGTGGLDASIFWELDRPENVGAAFNNTFGFFTGFYNARATASDLVALGTVVATSSCQGPRIPFRAGRVDAMKAGPAGVPEPSTNLADTLTAFEKSGFPKQDMVAMVACGHAIGGVHSVDFPDITDIPADPNNDTSVPFQTDVSSFHNGVVTEFLSGKTKNPLVVAKNDTLNSDKRIFNSDMATMKKLSTKAGFNSNCAAILERMINTVPKSVKLTNIIEPYDVRPYVTELSLTSKGDIRFAGTIRLRTTGGVRKADDVQVKLLYADRSGKGKVAISTTVPNWQNGISASITDQFVSFQFNATIPGKTGISKFWIQETVPSTKVTKTHDNQKTGGYKVDDTVLYQYTQSCYEVDKFANNKAPVIVKAMIPQSRTSDPLTLKITRKVPNQGVIVPSLKTELVPFKATGKKNNGWVEFKAQTWGNDFDTYFDIALGGANPKVFEFQSLNNMPTTCS